MLRIDVDAGAPYAVPADNPFRSTAGARARDLGVRPAQPVPLRRSTAPTGDLYIGDVGQGAVEEIDVQPRRGRGGRELRLERHRGLAVLQPVERLQSQRVSSCPSTSTTHAEGCSVTGGVVYRGCRMPDLAGTYFFGDYCSGFVRSFRFASGQATDVRDWTAGLARHRLRRRPSALDADGEVYVVDYDGEVYRLEPAS